MAVGTSLTSEVLAAIQMPNLKQIPAYLSEADAVNVHLFLQSEYTRDFAINISNINWVMNCTIAMFLTFMQVLVPPRIQ